MSSTKKKTEIPRDAACRPTIIAAARMRAAAKFEDGDKERYAKVCQEYRHEHKLNEGFDFFEYAADLPPDFDKWKPFIVSIRALGRYSTFSLSSENKEAEEKRVEELLYRASLMGKIINPIICCSIFPAIMYKSITSRHKCQKKCTEVLEQIVQGERSTKVRESHTNATVAIAAARASGIPNPTVAMMYSTPEVTTITIPAKTDSNQ